MTVDVADGAFELPMDASSSDSEFELSSLTVDNINGTRVVGVSMNTSTSGSFKVHKQS